MSLRTRPTVCRLRWFAVPLSVLAVGCPDADSNANVTVLSDSSFNAVPLRDPGIPGFHMPEPESTVVGWAADPDSAAPMSLHMWGLWTALTAMTDETYLGEPLRVFETWYTPDDIKASETSGAPLTAVSRRPRTLTAMNQLVPTSRAAATVKGFVKYDPSAAAFTESNDLMVMSVLQALLDRGATAIPNFPPTAMTLKPVFAPGFVEGPPLIQGRYYVLPAWPGPPPTPREWDHDLWGQCVWVDTRDPSDGPGTGAVDTACDTTNISRTPETTYGLGRFINFTIEETVYVLIGMHVTSRETTRWTWQTFWWTPTPDAPLEPSSPSIAAARPAQLQGAPRNYAGCYVYSMLDPPQPNTGGSNTGNSVYCYNPWLEAGFGPSVLTASLPGLHNGVPVRNDYGVQTNCMSCHAQARWPARLDSVNGYNPCSYTGDRYVNLDDPAFAGTLKLDFAWSIQGNVAGSDSVPSC